MALNQNVKTTFEARRTIQPIYTGGSVALSEDGTILASSLADEALLSDLDTGKHLARIEGDGEPITTLALAPDASFLVICSRSLSMRIYALQQSEDGIEAKLARTLKPHTTPVVTAAVDSTSSLLATGGADGVAKVWDLRGGYTAHTFHGHSGVISALHFFQAPQSGNTRSNGDDTHQSTSSFRLASGGEDGKLRIWDLHKRKSIAHLDAHASVVRTLDYSADHALLLSGSRDKTVMLWDARSWQRSATIPVLEEVESAGFTSDSAFFFTAGERGVLRIWDVSSGKEITEEQPAGAETDAVVQVLHYSGLKFLLSVHADQTLRLHGLTELTRDAGSNLIPPLSVYRRISGTHDEVIDLAYIGSNRDMLALATNLEDIRIVSIKEKTTTALSEDPYASQSYFGADVALLKGHSDVVITIDTDWSGHWLATGAKDNTAKLWRLDPENDSYTCYATFTGHAESIGAVGLPNAVPPTGSKEYNAPLVSPPKFLITGSQDKTVKRWEIPAVAGAGKTPRAVYTRKAHDKDINAIEVSYSSSTPLFASASQDRTVKIWDVETGEAIGVLRGHKRGVWSVAFSPLGMPQLTTNEAGGASTAKGMVVTGSGDKTVRIWSLSDYTCLRTFEGHANSVLKVVWLPVPDDRQKAQRTKRSVQVASAAGDGLVKVWDAQEGECAATLDNHIDRVWALAVRPPPIVASTEQGQKQHQDAMDVETDDNETDQVSTIELVSGSADSTLTFWTDTTATTAQRATTQATARIEQDQALQNHMRSQNYREAIVLALQLNHPKRLLELFTAVVNGPHDTGSLTGRTAVDDVLATLSDGQLWNLLRRLRDWNANARTHHVAQHVLYAILRLHPREKLLRLRRRRMNQPASSMESDDVVEGQQDQDQGAEHSKDKSKERLRDVLDALRAYTERHYARLEKAADERFVMLWALQQMDEVGGADGQVQMMNGNEFGHVNGHDGDEVMINGTG